MAKAKQPRGLSVKQRRFIEAYDGNATAAAIAAGYSPKTARSQGQYLLTKLDIKEAIKAREESDFSSVEEMALRCGLSKSIIELLRKNGALEGLPETDQISLIDMIPDAPDKKKAKKGEAKEEVKEEINEAFIDNTEAEQLGFF